MPLFAVARVLIHGSDLPEDDAWQILMINAGAFRLGASANCATSSAAAGKLTRSSKPRGHLLVRRRPLKKYFPMPPKATENVRDLSR